MNWKGFREEFAKEFERAIRPDWKELAKTATHLAIAIYAIVAIFFFGHWILISLFALIAMIGASKSIDDAHEKRMLKKQKPGHKLDDIF